MKGKVPKIALKFLFSRLLFLIASLTHSWVMGGIDQTGLVGTIREQVGQQKTRDRVGRSKQVIRKGVIGKQANLGAIDWGVIKIKNTVRNE